MNSAADLFIPTSTVENAAIARTTHLGIGAHQDDLEFMAFHGIVETFYSKTKWFGAITCTNGVGSSTSGAYADIAPEELGQIRSQEQRTAASIGRYSFVAQLGYPSREIVRPAAGPLISDLIEIMLQIEQPEIFYTHNPADKHETHVRVLVAVLEALRELPAGSRPRQLLGCEMWRSLDWLPDSEKVILDSSGHAHLAAALNGLYDSQIAGGKRYDLAVMGRRRANATLFNSHEGDSLTEATFAMDLTSLIGAQTSDLVDFTLQYVATLQQDIRSRLERSLLS